MALKLGLNLGYWGIGPQGDEAVEIVQAVEKRRLRLGLGGRVLRLRRGQRARLAGGEDRDDPARRGDPAGAGAAPGGGGDGGRDDRRALGRALHLRLRALGPAGLGGLVRRPVREAVGPHARVRRGRQARSSPARAGSSTQGEHYTPAADRGRGRHRPGQGAEAQLPPGPQRDPDLRRRDRPQVGRVGRRGLRRLDPDLLLGRRVARTTWGEHIEAGLKKGGRTREDFAVSPSVQVAIDGDLDAARNDGQDGPAALPRRDGLEGDQLLRRPHPPLRLRRGRRRGAVASTSTASARRPTRRSPTSSSTRPR